MQQNQLFRQKSIDRISSPEQLRDYMRVTSPRLWMILAAIVVLLVGFIVYASTTQMESTVTVRMTYSSPAYIYGEIPAGRLDVVKVDMPVRIGGYTGKVTNTSTDSRYRLDITLDSGVRLEESYYLVTIGESADVEPFADSEEQFMVEYYGGVFSCSSMNAAERFGRGDLRVRIWELAANPETYETELSGGHLATISGGGTYIVGTVVAALDDPGASLDDSGVYDAEIVTESTTPISFLFNLE